MEQIGDIKVMRGSRYVLTSLEQYTSATTGDSSVTKRYTHIPPPPPTRYAEDWRDSLAAWMQRNDYVLLSDIAQQTSEADVRAWAGACADVQFRDNGEWLTSNDGWVLSEPLYRYRVPNPVADEFVREWREKRKADELYSHYFPTVAPQYERVVLYRDRLDMLVYGDGWLHTEAMSEPGFAGYEYADGYVSPRPCLMINGKTVLPVAWRRSL